MKHQAQHEYYVLWCAQLGVSLEDAPLTFEQFLNPLERERFPVPEAGNPRPTPGSFAAIDKDLLLRISQRRAELKRRADLRRIDIAVASAIAGGRET